MHIVFHAIFFKPEKTWKTYETCFIDLIRYEELTEAYCFLFVLLESPNIFLTFCPVNCV